MSELTVIANTGIHFHRFSFKVDKTLMRSRKFVYLEDVDLGRQRFWLEELVHLPDVDLFARKSELARLGYLDSKGALLKNSNLEFISQKFSDNHAQVFDISSVDQVLRVFKSKWLPLPFFKFNSINQDVFGPTDWVRLYFESTVDGRLDIVLAIDSSVSDQKNCLHSPYLDDNPQENKFKLCSNEELILAFMDKLTDCQWVEDYVKRYFQFELGDSSTKHIAYYLFLLRILKSSDSIPSIHLLSDKAGTVDVDLVLDVGNSQTCALLFENPNDLKFNLNKVKRLEIVDLRRPVFIYNQSFSTRIVFSESNFCDPDYEINQHRKFQWTSFARVGSEAERLINHMDIATSLKHEAKSFNSSPKRYLWDREPSLQDWTFYSENSSSLVKRVFQSGISEQLKSDGSLCGESVFGTNSRFSRKSLMTFVYLEIISHAYRQMNSFEFRVSHGEPAAKRRFKRVIISCPTAMIKEEQVALRQCAQDALKLWRNFNVVSSGEIEILENIDIEVLPNPEDLSKVLKDSEKRKDWIYDEATVGQLMFLYGMIQHKFNANPELFFNLFGRQRTTESLRKSLVVGSLDIGAGTSDLMICKYDYNFSESTEIIPDPLYWESFVLAGDDLIRNIIQEIVIEGRVENDSDKLCSGVILDYGRSRGDSDIVLKINGFFGKDNANQGYKSKLMRVAFVNQIGVPIAQRYLQAANEESSSEIILQYQDLFVEEKPSKDLLDYFEKHFSFRFEELHWKISKSKVDKIISSTYDKLLGQVASIMQLKGCDIIVLSGRPCSLESLEQTLLSFFPVAPNRVFNLNNYWIGKWFPFADDNGFIKDPKTVIAVGSLLSVLGGKLFKLDKFRINDYLLKEKLVSTANFIGGIKDYTIASSFIGPSEEESSFLVYDIPFDIGFKQIDSTNYPSRYLYSFQFNTVNIREQLGLNLTIDSNTIQDEIENRKTRLRSRLPFKVTVQRDFESDKEKLKITAIEDNAGESISKSNFNLKLITLNRSDEFWLDSGEFNLTIS